MFRLPKWILPDRFPAIFDAESHTAIEMTSKLYGAINDFVDEYNKFASETTQMLNEHLEGYRQTNETFRTGLRQEFQDFIDTIDLKVVALENASNQAIVAYKDEITNMFNTYRGELDGVRDTINEVRTSCLDPEEVAELKGMASTLEGLDEVKATSMTFDDINFLMDYTSAGGWNFGPIVYPMNEEG